MSRSYIYFIFIVRGGPTSNCVRRIAAVAGGWGEQYWFLDKIYMWGLLYIVRELCNFENPVLFEIDT